MAVALGVNANANAIPGIHGPAFDSDSAKIEHNIVRCYLDDSASIGHRKVVLSRRDANTTRDLDGTIESYRWQIQINGGPGLRGKGAKRGAQEKKQRESDHRAHNCCVSED
jgi:hypothetical protein